MNQIVFSHPHSSKNKYCAPCNLKLAVLLTVISTKFQLIVQSYCVACVMCQLEPMSTEETDLSKLI